MRRIKEVLRLRYELKLDQRQIARSCSLSVSTVHEYLKRAEAAGLVWPLPEDWDHARVEAALFRYTESRVAPKKSPPDFAGIHDQLRRHRHLTLQLLWQEYLDAYPHRPKSHKAHLEWTPSRMVHWAQTIGPHTAQLFERIMADKPHPEMGYRHLRPSRGPKWSARLSNPCAWLLRHGRPAKSHCELTRTHYLSCQTTISSRLAQDLQIEIQHATGT